MEPAECAFAEVDVQGSPAKCCVGLWFASLSAPVIFEAWVEQAGLFVRSDGHRRDSSWMRRDLPAGGDPGSGDRTCPATAELHGRDHHRGHYLARPSQCFRWFW